MIYRNGFRRGLSDSAAMGVSILIALFLVAGITFGGCVGYPKYKVYKKGMDGQAQLKEAESNRQIEVLEAKAKMESAESLAQAEIIRAEGVAKSNEIIGDSLKDNDAYLRYLWVQGLNDGTGEVVYIPTEGNLPILEATRMQRDGPKQ